MTCAARTLRPSKWRIFGISLLFLCLTTSVFGKTFDHEHSQWTASLTTFVDKQGWVDYSGWKKNHSQLDEYLKSLEAVSLETYEGWSAEEKKAFLINAYNAFTVKLILDHYPVKSIRSIGSIFRSSWKREFFSLLDGQLKSLDPIEHQWLRKKPELKDPRVHAVVNCASVSCPKLLNEAFVATKLDQQMTEATKDWLADPSKNTFLPNKRTVKLSKIFDWYKEDFGNTDEGVAAFVRQYGPESAKASLQTPFRLVYLDYDWDLNEKK
ncbi:MAG: DUF547 domain-containing protein [Oligoflexus sp.]